MGTEANGECLYRPERLLNRPRRGARMETLGVHGLLPPATHVPASRKRALDDNPAHPQGASAMGTTRCLAHVWLPAALVVAVALSSYGQPPQSSEERARRMTEFLGRMDQNHDGRLDPQEISDRARPFVERMLREAGLDPARPVSIRDLQERVRRQSDSRGGGPPSGPPAGPGGFGGPDSNVPGFGPPGNRPPIPGFGDGGRA